MCPENCEENRQQGAKESVGYPSQGNHIGYQQDNRTTEERFEPVIAVGVLKHHKIPQRKGYPR